MVNSPQHSRHLSGNTKLALDFAPLAVFFIAFKFSDVLTATLALIISTILCMTIIYWYERKIALAPLISGILVTVLGGLTYALQDERFIKMKPTFVNLLFAAVLLGGVFIAKKGLLKYVLDIAFSLTAEGWRILSMRWGFYFVFLAVLNEIIWRNFPTEFWVNFKVFGMLTLTVLFTLSQLRLIEKHKDITTD